MLKCMQWWESRTNVLEIREEGKAMTAIQLKKDEYLVHKGDPLKSIYIVLRGAVNLQTEYSQISLGSGSVLGLVAEQANAYVCDYVATEDTLVACYKYENPEDFGVIFQEQPKYAYAFLHAAVTQCKNIYDMYTELEQQAKRISDFVTKQYSDYEIDCSQTGFEQKEVAVAELQQVTLPEPILTWESAYFRELMEQPEKTLRYYYNEHHALCVGEILKVAEMMGRMLVNMDGLREFLTKAKETLICEEEDLVELWFDYAMKLAHRGDSLMMVQVKILEIKDFLLKIGFYTEEEVNTRIRYYTAMDFQSYVLTHQAEEAATQEELGEVAESMSREDVLKTDFPAYIMNYAGYDEEAIAKCKEVLKSYAVVAVAQDNTTTECQRVRKELTNLFYDIYERAFLRASKARSISPVMELFFQFGVLDLTLVGEVHLDELLHAVEKIHAQQDKQKELLEVGETITKVFTAFQWLCMVYKGEREPSKNEFDVDYAGDLLEQRKSNLITRAQENELKHDQLKKLQFELRNMFVTNNRITYGRITSFCPVLHEKDFTRSAEQMMLTFERVNEAVNEVRGLDYSCFYREVHFMAPQQGIDRTEIMKEVLPEVILMPNIGNRAMMWQETSGVKRDTSARFVFPIMTIGDLSQMMLETAGRYRWEICRKILGVRWNDIREKSLTSEFYDYVQFYRKNRDLSAQAKEKVKADLLHAKNSYREVFVADYVDWMKYESQGSFRLNKVSRRIISDYIPFPSEVRKKLADNPMFKELFTKSTIIMGRKREKERILFERYTANGGVMTAELQAHMDFYNK